MEAIKYKEFIGSVHFSAEDEVFHGKIEGINALVTFEGETVTNLKKAFIEAVDDYLIFCKEKGISPEKSYKGSFNVRIEPKLHKQASFIAVAEGITLNQFVQRAIEQEIHTKFSF